MGIILDHIAKAAAAEEKLLAILVDPDKFEGEKASVFLERIPRETDLLFVGGSTVDPSMTESTVAALKKHSRLPVILFPGDVSQITHLADGILFLSLLSGRNPEYLIEQQIKAASVLSQTRLEIIPTGYILLNGGNESAVERVSRTSPISQEEIGLIRDTALAGEYLGKRMIYLEAGSGASVPVLPGVISEVKKAVSVPLIVGGGIRSRAHLKAAFDAGADLVVIGTAYEQDGFPDSHE